MFVRERVSPPGLLDGEGPADQGVPEFRFVIERAPHRLVLVTQELIRVDLTVAKVRRYDQGPIGDEDPMDLTKRTTQVGAWEMVDRVERHHGREGLRSKGKSPHVAAREAATTHALGCETKHLRGKIRSDHFYATNAQVLSDLARSAAEVEDRTHSGWPSRLVKNGSVNRKVTEVIAEGDSVFLCDQVVGGTDCTGTEWLHRP